MSNFLQGLLPAPMSPTAGPNPTATMPAATPNASGPKNTKANPFAAAAANPEAAKPLMVLKAVSAGKLPGVVIPHDAPKIDSGLTPADIQSAGVGIYKPTTKGIAAVLFHPASVPATTLKALDKAGKLAKAFPSITKLMGDKSTDKASPGGEVPNAVSTDPAAPDASQPSAINDLNLTGNPAPSVPATIPILPKPSFSADAQKQIAARRAALVTGNVAPSARPIPGGGGVLNGLMQQPV